MHIPQNGLLTAGALATANLKDTVAVLPAGVTLNPSAASSLKACTEAQAGLIGTNFPPPNPIHFNTTSQGCPDTSKIGTAEVITSLLDRPSKGSVYLATQDSNPLRTEFAIYLVVEDARAGVHATLIGSVEPDPITGRITTAFLDSPQVPIDEVTLDFFSGSRAALVNPDTCGTFNSHATLTPWSANDPENPTKFELARPSDQVEINAGPAGLPCIRSKALRPFRPTFAAGMTTASAGKASPFVLRVTRSDGEQEFDRLGLTAPPGFTAILKGISACSDAAIDAAGGKSGKREVTDASCPTASEVGTVVIGSGAGPTPVYVRGKIYLSGPYRMAPVSLVFIVPAIAGPFDLGVQTLRIPLYLDPVTGQVNASSNAIPQIMDGIPLQIRDVRIAVDRPNFLLNPTNCEVMSVNGYASGTSGAVTNLSTRFQVGECDKLGFKPKLSFRLKGGTNRGDHPSLNVTLRARPGDANIANISTVLPRSEFLDNSHIKTVCTRSQFAAHECPAGSIYGHVTATSPLVDYPVRGPVYLRSSSNLLPDLVMSLHGPESQPLEIAVSGRTDSIHGSLRTRFDAVPDLPVTKLHLVMRGGARGLLINSHDICKHPGNTIVRLSAQNGRQILRRLPMKNDCSKKAAYSSSGHEEN